MINYIIQWSVRNTTLVLMLCILLGLAAFASLWRTPVDAIPDLSDVQVIIKSEFPGQAPKIVEDQVTFPISAAMQKVPGATTVRGYSYFGDSFVYVLFDDQTDPYWARSRVLEVLSQINNELPVGVSTQLGPDASGVGWILEYALVDTHQKRGINELTTLQNWYLKQHLQSVSGVSEVATVGGMIDAFQIVVDPVRLAEFNLSLPKVIQRIQEANSEVGGGVVEQAEAEYIVRVKGYRQSVADFQKIPIGFANLKSGQGSVLLGDIANVQRGPYMRRGVAELDGQGEVVGGIIVMTSGENPLKVIENVKAKLNLIESGLPDGVEVRITYDRSELIQSSIDNLRNKIILEILLVSIICFIFLRQVRSSLVAAFVLPFSVLLSVFLMNLFQINANIMSLGGIAIAIGTLIDATLVMIENVHRKLETGAGEVQQSSEDIAKKVMLACKEVGPGIFFSLLIITVSFLPIFALEAQEGKLFKPLAYTKSFAMAFGAILSITLIPVLLVLLTSKAKTGDAKTKPKQETMWMKRIEVGYRKSLSLALKAPKTVLMIVILMVGVSVYPYQKLGSEFMPTMNEGDILYMPTTLPGISIGKASQLLQQTDRLIKSVPEVKQVFGKIGRAETATDPAPLTMIETTIQLKPESQWRDGMTMAKIIEELDATVQVPGLTNSWVPPIKTRIDMLSTGVKTPIAIKVSGPKQSGLTELGKTIETELAKLVETASVYAERPSTGRFVEITPRLQDLSEYGFSLAEFNRWIANGVGGVKVDDVIIDNQRFPVSVRLPREYRESIDELSTMPIYSSGGGWFPLERVADVKVVEAPPMIKTENSQPISWVFIEPAKGVSLGEYIAIAEAHLAENVDIPNGYLYQFSGQYEYLERIEQKLSFIVPIIIGLIVVLLYMAFNHLKDVLIVLVSMPLAIVGGIWLLWLMEFNISVAVFVGFIALAGVAVEFGVIMLMYLHQAKGPTFTDRILNGACDRLRPKLMTVVTVWIGLLPIVLGGGIGSEVMQPLAAPMLGGMFIAPLLSLYLIPVMYQWAYQVKEPSR